MKKLVTLLNENLFVMQCKISCVEQQPSPYLHATEIVYCANHEYEKNSIECNINRQTTKVTGESSFIFICK